MKKSIIVALLALTTTFAFAIPNGCYNGASGMFRGIRCAIQIGGDAFNVLNSDGYVKARYTIVGDDNGRLTLQSEYGTTVYASWWTEDGQVYIKFNESILVRD